MKVRNLTTSASDTQLGNKKTRLRNPTELSIPAEIATDYSRPNNMELKSTSSNFRRGVVPTMVHRLAENCIDLAFEPAELPLVKPFGLTCLLISSAKISLTSH